MSDNGTRHVPAVLTSWKEIASYLGKGVRTVQRWEAQFGLPVRRPNERCKGIVHAKTEDLDRWLAEKWTQRPAMFEAEKPEPRALNLKLTDMTAHIESARKLRQQHRALLDQLKAVTSVFHKRCEDITVTLGGNNGQKPAH